MFMYDMMYF